MNPTVLLVEETEAIRNVMAGALRRAGYLVIEASSGPDAIAFADFHVGPIDVLVADLGLNPELDLELAIGIRRPGLRVLDVSGTHRNGPVEHVIAKPFSMEQLVKKVGEVLEGAA